LIVLNKIFLNLTIDESLKVGQLGRIADKVDNLDGLLKECKELIKPAAIYTFTKIEKVLKDGLLLSEGKFLKSSKLAEQLSCSTEIAPYIMTIGPDLERRVTSIGTDKILDSWILDNLGTYALRTLGKHIEGRIRNEKGWKISRFNPGSTPSWNLEEQEKIFSIFSKKTVQERIGVRLTESFMMVPRKSVSGVVGQAISAYHNCQECRLTCDYRQAEYKRKTS
jgi:hypothetical protein